MSELILIDDESNETRETIAKLKMEGKTSRAVAMKLHMKVVEVDNYWAQWQEIARSKTNQDLAEDYLHRLVGHFDEIIAESYLNLDNLKSMKFDEKASAQINTTLKNIAEYERQRLDALQKAGLLDGADLGDELAEREEREAIIIEMLRSDLCPDCMTRIKSKMEALTGVVEGTVVDE